MGPKSSFWALAGPICPSGRITPSGLGARSGGFINDLLLGIIRIDAHGPFFAKNPFSPADEFVFTGLVVQSCHFDVTACAKACFFYK